MIVAIDGPAGAGKSTVARALARKEQLTYLDTGAMYRAITYAALTRGLDMNDEAAIGELARSCTIRMGEETSAEKAGPTIAIDGVDCTSAIRTPKVDDHVSEVSALAAVREAMLIAQRKLACGHDVVVEGRDIGTVVFPEAEVKIFLTADVSARGRRRAVQRAGGDMATDPHARIDAASEQLCELQLAKRDAADSSRALSPLRPAADAHHIDSTTLTVDEVCERISHFIREARA